MSIAIHARSFRIAFVCAILFFASRICIAATHKLSLKDLDGKEVSISPKQGETYVIGVFASWCPTCHKTIEGIHNVLSKGSFPGAKFITISVDVDRTAIPKYITKNKALFDMIKSEVYWDGGGAALQAFGLEGVPATLVLQGNGKASFFTGMVPEDKLVNLLKSGI